MNQIQIHSVAKVFDRPGVLERVMTLVSKVAAMGLLPKSRRIEALDEDSFRVVLNSLQSGNLIGGRGPALSRIITAPATGASTKEQIAELDRLLTTIEESPVPAKEWAAMREIFDDEELSRFLDASTSSIKRYSAGERSTPVETADRLHWLAMVVADLAGSYNEFGIRRWFHRHRAQLDGKSPFEILGKNWSSDTEAAKRVRELARSLSAGGAT